MPRFAVLNGEDVLNIIVADSKEFAEELLNMTCIEITEADSAEAGGFYIDGIFVLHKPYPSWVLNSEYKWEAPIPYPVVGEGSDEEYIWDENTTSWLLLPPSN